MSDPAEPAFAKSEAAANPRFRLPIYEGPLDLLLHLIKRAEVSPRDVATGAITEQYLTYLEMLDRLNLDVAGEYLVMAATLLLIKSLSLLPHPQTADVEEAEELKSDLVARLLEYQRLREAAEKLAGRPLLGRDVFVGPGEAAPADDGATPLRVSVFDLVEAMGEVLKRIAGRAPREIAVGGIPVEDCIPTILGALERSARIKFQRLFEDVHNRRRLIATFLALLELIRQGRVHAWQENRMGPIWLSRRAAQAGSPKA